MSYFHKKTHVHVLKEKKLKNRPESYKFRNKNLLKHARMCIDSIILSIKVSHS